MLRKLTQEDLQRAQIPRRYWETSIAQIPDNMAYKEKIINYIKGMSDLVVDGVGLYLYSVENSTGKTSIACIIGKYALRMKFTVLYIMSANYTDMVISGEMLDEVQSIEDRAKTVDVLIIDDAVKEYRGSSGFTENKIENLIRYRSQNLRTTIITSNTPPIDIQKVYSRDLSAIMRECMIPIKVVGMDWRAIKERELRNLI